MSTRMATRSMVRPVVEHTHEGAWVVQLSLSPGTTTAPAISAKPSLTRAFYHLAAVFSNVVGLRFDRANDASWLARVDASDNQHHVKVAGPHGFTIQQLMIENPTGVALTSDGGGDLTCTNSVAKPWGGGEWISLAATQRCTRFWFLLSNKQ